MAAFTQKAGNVNSRISSTSWCLICSKTGSLHTSFCWSRVTMNREGRFRVLKHTDQKEKPLSNTGCWGLLALVFANLNVHDTTLHTSKDFRYSMPDMVLQCWILGSGYLEKILSLNTSLSYHFDYCSIENEPKPSKWHSELLSLASMGTRTLESSQFESNEYLLTQSNYVLGNLYTSLVPFFMWH